MGSGRRPHRPIEALRLNPDGDLSGDLSGISVGDVYFIWKPPRGREGGEVRGRGAEGPGGERINRKAARKLKPPAKASVGYSGGDQT